MVTRERDEGRRDRAGTRMWRLFACLALPCLALSLSCLVDINSRVEPPDRRAASPPAAECPSRPRCIHCLPSTRPLPTCPHRSLVTRRHHHHHHSAPSTLNSDVVSCAARLPPVSAASVDDAHGPPVACKIGRLPRHGPSATNILRPKSSTNRELPLMLSDALML